MIAENPGFLEHRVSLLDAREREHKATRKLFIPLSHNGSGLMPCWVMPMFISALNGLLVEMPVIGDSHADRAMNKLANEVVAFTFRPIFSRDPATLDGNAALSTH